MPYLIKAQTHQGQKHCFAFLIEITYLINRCCSNFAKKFIDSDSAYSCNFRIVPVKSEKLQGQIILLRFWLSSLMYQTYFALILQTSSLLMKMQYSCSFSAVSYQRAKSSRGKKITLRFWLRSTYLMNRFCSIFTYKYTIEDNAINFRLKSSYLKFWFVVLLLLLLFKIRR